MFVKNNNRFKNSQIESQVTVKQYLVIHLNKVGKDFKAKYRKSQLLKKKKIALLIRENSIF